MFKRGGYKVFSYFIGPGRPVEIKDGGKISMTLGLLIYIYYIAHLLLSFSLFLQLFELYKERIKYLGFLLI